jgi:hypothetical protein
MGLKFTQQNTSSVVFQLRWLAVSKDLGTVSRSRELNVMLRFRLARQAIRVFWPPAQAVATEVTQWIAAGTLPVALAGIRPAFV